MSRTSHIKTALLVGAAFAYFLPLHAYAVGEEIKKQLTESTNDLMHGYKVKLTQNAITGNIEPLVEIASAFGQATVKKEQDIMDRVIDKVVNYTGAVGGLPDLMQCGRVSEEKGTQQAQEESQKEASYFTKKWATFVPDAGRLDIKKEILQNHYDNFCTVSDAQNNLCKLVKNGMSAGDIDYSVCYGTMTMHEDKQYCAYSFANMLVGANSLDPAMLRNNEAARNAHDAFRVEAARTNQVMYSFMWIANERFSREFNALKGELENKDFFK